jgi:predicted transcriptional regulator
VEAEPPLLRTRCAMPKLTQNSKTPIFGGMEVHFTPEQLMRLSQVANYNGTDTEQLVKEAALRVVEENEDFRAAVRRGIEQADRGELVPHEEVVARIERLLQP